MSGTQSNPAPDEEYEIRLFTTRYGELRARQTDRPFQLVNVPYYRGSGYGADDAISLEVTKLSNGEKWLKSYNSNVDDPIPDGSCADVTVSFGNPDYPNIAGLTFSKTLDTIKVDWTAEPARDDYAGVEIFLEPLYLIDGSSGSESSILVEKGVGSHTFTGLTGGIYGFTFTAAYGGEHYSEELGRMFGLFEEPTSRLTVDCTRSPLGSEPITVSPSDGVEFGYTEPLDFPLENNLELTRKGGIAVWFVDGIRTDEYSVTIDMGSDRFALALDCGFVP